MVAEETRNLEQDKQIGRLWTEVKRLWDAFHGPNCDNGLKSRVVALEASSSEYATKEEVKQVREEILQAIKDSKKTGTERLKAWAPYVAILSGLVVQFLDKVGG